MMSDLNISHEKMSDFVSFIFFEFTLVIKLKNLILKVIEILKYSMIKKDMASDLNMSHGKMSDFVSFPLLGLILEIKYCYFKTH